MIHIYFRCDMCGNEIDEDDVASGPDLFPCEACDDGGIVCVTCRPAHVGAHRDSLPSCVIDANHPEAQPGYQEATDD